MAGTEIFLFSVPARLPLMPNLHPLQRLVGVWEAHYSPSSNSEVKNAWRFTSISLLSSWHCAEWSMEMSLYFYLLVEFCWTYTLRGLCRIANTILLGITVNFVPLVIMEMQHKDHHLIAWSVLVLYQFHPTSKYTRACVHVCLCLPCVSLSVHTNTLEFQFLANKTCEQKINIHFRDSSFIEDRSFTFTSLSL
jgi:hypothetical protein